jgi:hypothetical protein
LTHQASGGTAVIDESIRPSAPKQPGTIGPAGRYRQQTLVAIHDHLRQDLDRILRAVESAAAGETDPGTARAAINDSVLRGNYQLTGTFCAQYCRIVTMHHTIETQYLFPNLGGLEATLQPVLDQLNAEHEIIHEILVRLDSLLLSMINDHTGATAVAAEARALQTALVSHLAYEENELLDPLGRLPVQL